MQKRPCNAETVGKLTMGWRAMKKTTGKLVNKDPLMASGLKGPVRNSSLYHSEYTHWSKCNKDNN